MKRDVDLCRQLLLDLEAHGAECAASVLRNGTATDADERVRYHMRLLIDAGLAKQVDRSANGLASVRLTNSGAELIELCRSDARWRDAKAVVLEQTGGLSLTVLRAVLTKWAVEAAAYGTPRRGWRPARPGYRYVEPRGRYEAYHHDIDYLSEDDLRLVRTVPDYRERSEVHFGSDLNGYDRHGHDSAVGVSMPIYLV